MSHCYWSTTLLAHCRYTVVGFGLTRSKMLDAWKCMKVVSPCCSQLMPLTRLSITSCFSLHVKRRPKIHAMTGVKVNWLTDADIRNSTMTSDWQKTAYAMWCTFPRILQKVIPCDKWSGIKKGRFMHRLFPTDPQNYTLSFFFFFYI